jgi:uracil-DNA glycosylase
MIAAFPDCIERSLLLADPSWLPHLRAGLVAMTAVQPDYLNLLASLDFLPTGDRIFAAFALPISSVRYILMGEGPYPRSDSATGVCFMDGAVKSLWQPGVGLTKSVNRATSLRNFIKMLLVADGVLNNDNTTANALLPVATMACVPGSGYIQTGADLQLNLISQGFLLLNASLVFRPGVAPAQDAKSWRPFLRTILRALINLRNERQPDRQKLILWGKIAREIGQLPEAEQFVSMVSEHPYNLSFIENKCMQNLFRPLHILRK